MLRSKAQPLKQLLKLVACVLLSNKFAGMSDKAQPLKQASKLVAFALLSNNPAGMPDSEVQP